MAEQVTFWNGDDDQHYGNCQDIGEGGSLLVGSPTKPIRANAEARGEDGYRAGSPVPKWTKSTGQQRYRYRPSQLGEWEMAPSESQYS